jgi:hypothetical protein
MLAVQAEIPAHRLGERVLFNECARIKKGLDPLPGSQNAFPVDFLDFFLPGSGMGLSPAFPQFPNRFLHSFILGQFPTSWAYLMI